MRYYSDEILEEVRKEIAVIWAAHRLHRLNGKMRLYAPKSQQIWKSHEAGYEFWFGPGEIDEAIKKIDIFYKHGQLPNTPLLLDPMVYLTDSKGEWKPQGSGVLWASCFTMEDLEIKDEAIQRIQDLGIYHDFLHYRDSKQAGLKMLALLDEPTISLNRTLPSEGSIAKGVQELANLIDINSNQPQIRHYLLSGLDYRMSHGAYQHPHFQDLFNGEEITTSQDLRDKQINLQAVLDADTCWEAYDRNPLLYRRYGSDIQNLEKNLAVLSESDRDIEEIKRELALIWQAQRRHGLDGKMRLFTAPTQEHWRAKEPGTEIWFNHEELDEAARKIKMHYNAGQLPNSPLFLDPIVYEMHEGNYVPVGTGVVWSTALYVGLDSFDKSALSRLDELGMITGIILRSEEAKAGIKVLGFLDRPYVFSEEEIDAYFSPETEKQGTKKEPSPASNNKDDNNSQKLARDGFATPGCKELFDLTNSKGDNYWKYFLLTGQNYLSTHGSFGNHEMSESLEKGNENIDALLEKHTISLKQLSQAHACWEAYDHNHILWERFKIDTKQLNENLKYFNLCGRDFGLLDATGVSRKGREESFEFFIPGWIPKGSVTLLAAAGGLGKSTLAHNLSLMASTDYGPDDTAPKWLGSPINLDACTGLSIYFSGDDSTAIINARNKVFDPDNKAKRFMLQHATFGENEHGEKISFGEFLEKLHTLPDISLIVIDPARKYLNSDEEDSEAVSQFFNTLEDLAIAKNCAILVLHSLEKGARPKDTRDILDALRGSQVFINRPRVVIGLLQEGAHIIAGLAKNNIPPKLGMVEGERIFVRDPENLDLLWLPGSEGVRSFVLSEDELRQIKQNQDHDVNQTDPLISPTANKSSNVS